MKYDSWQPPSLPHITLPQARGYRSSPARPAATSRQSLQRIERSTLWFQLYRRGGRVILHHGHIRPVLIRDWPSKMDGITSTIWASQTTLPLGPRDRLNLARLRCVRQGAADKITARLLPPLTGWWPGQRPRSIARSGPGG
jgi:hypothetical protein